MKLRYRTIVPVGAALLMVLAAAPWTSSMANAASAAKGTTIVIGTMESQTGSGVSGTVTTGTDVVTAWVKWTNAHGGLDGHPVKLYTANDNDDPAQAQVELNKLVTQDHIVALVGQDAEGTEPTWAAYMAAQKVPVIGGAGYSTNWFTNPMFYPVTTTVLSAVWGGEYALKLEHIKKEALLQCNNASVCTSAVPLIQAAAKQNGIDLVYSETASETATDYTAQCLAMKASGATAVEATVNDELLARNCATQGYKPIWVFADNDVTYAELKDTPAFNGALGFSDAFPWFSAKDFPQYSAYYDAMKKYASEYLPGGSKWASEAEGLIPGASWASGVVFGNAIKNADVPADKPVTSADVVRGLSMIQDSTNGGYTPPVSYGNGTTPSQQVPCFWLDKVVKSQWAPIDGTKTFCEPTSDLIKI
jgi:branched-chain amino acid transport system substrate-binding protein